MYAVRSLTSAQPTQWLPLCSGTWKPQTRGRLYCTKYCMLCDHANKTALLIMSNPVLQPCFVDGVLALIPVKHLLSKGTRSNALLFLIGRKGGASQDEPRVQLY